MMEMLHIDHEQYRLWDLSTTLLTRRLTIDSDLLPIDTQHAIHVVNIASIALSLRPI